MSLFDRLRLYFFPPVTRNAALEIATRVLMQSVTTQPLICHETLPDNFHLYATWSEPCWYVQILLGDTERGPFMLDSSRVIVIGRQTGKIYYDGSTGE